MTTSTLQITQRIQPTLGEYPYVLAEVAPTHSDQIIKIRAGGGPTSNADVASCLAGALWVTLQYSGIGSEWDLIRAALADLIDEWPSAA